MFYYYPYKSDKPNKKFFIITDDNRKVYFGETGYNDYIIYNKKYGKDIADKKKKAYIARHSKMNENWTKSGINTAGFWSRWYLWNLPTKEASYNYIKINYLL